MKWLELIRVQTAEIPGERDISDLLHFMDEIAASSGLMAAEVYTNASVKGNLAVSLVWNTGQPKPNGSFIGLNIREAMKIFGLVDHSVWIKRK